METNTFLKEDKEYCFKCKKEVKKVDFNYYYGICEDCVNKSTGH